MSTSHSLRFSQLFGGMWRVFRSCYGAVLGWSLLVALLPNILSQFAMKLGLPGSVLLGVLLLIGLLVIAPITAYLKYDVIKRARRKLATNGSAVEPAKSKMYGNVVLISLFALVLFLPGMILGIAGLPAEVKQLEWAGLTQNQAAANKMLESLGVKQAEKKDAGKVEGAGEKDLGEKGKTDQRQAKAVGVALEKMFMPTPAQAVLLILGFLAWVTAALAGLTWIPWAWMALLDPRTEAATAGAALGYARQLTKSTCSGPVRWSIFGVMVVMQLIVIGSFGLCCIGIIFLGMPLMFAFGPGLYLTMRGE
jgi:hypothetical protein